MFFTPEPANADAKYVPTGSTSLYCQQFKHYKTGKLVHVLWTIRGKRPVSVKVPAGTTLKLFDPNDNVTSLQEKNGAITFDFHQIERGAVPSDVEGRYGADFVSWCFKENRDMNPRSSAKCSASCAAGTPVAHEVASSALR